MQLLLVEDTDDLRRLFARILRCGGFDVREAADGHEALDCLASFRPDLVLTDLMMPGLDGFELIRRLRAMPEMARVPILAMTAAASCEFEREALSAGAEDVLAKPIDYPMLLDSLGHYC